MKRLWTLFLMALAMAAVSWPDAPSTQAQQKAKDPVPDIVVPASISIRNGHMAKLSAQTVLTSIKWLNLNQDLDVIDTGLGWVMVNAHVGDDGVCKGGVVKGNVATYQIGVYGAKLSADGKSALATDPVYIAVNVTLPSPPPPPPPPPPQPTLDLSAAWAAETDPAKAGEAVLLQSLYAYAAGSAGVGNVTTVTDWSQLSSALAAKATSLGVSGKLPNVQTAVAQAFVAAVPAAASGAGNIAPADRSAAAAFFTQAAAAVGALK